jgi:tetratricopeptide (TPR) repeat protein
MSNRIKQNLNNTGTTAPLAAAPDDGMAGDAGSYVAGDGNLFAALQQAAIAPGIGYAPGANPAGIAGQAGTPAPGGGGVGGGVVGAAQSGSFVAALTNLQNTNIPTEPSTAVDPQSFRAETQQQLTHFIQQNQGQFNAADGQTIDVISMLFDFFFDDDALPAPIKVLIGRLQIPMLKVAIIDKDFFNKKKHPARKLLDSISSAALGWSDNHGDQQALIKKTEEVVGFLINEFDQDIGVFEEAYINFENFLAEENAEIEKAEQTLLLQEQENDQQIQQAQEAAAELIEKLIDKRELSFAVTDFLETTWTSVLFKAYLSLGESSNHWKNLKRISTTFVWTLVPKFSEVDRVKIIKTIPVLLRALSKGMDLVKINSAVQNRIFLMLAMEHSKIVKRTAKNIGTGIVDQAARTKDAAAESLAQALAIDPAEEPDFKISSDATGEIQIVDIEVDDDSIATIDAAETIDVLNDLNEFTTGVKDGEIQVDEEIVLASDDGEIVDLLEQEDGFLEQAQALEIGNWVEFTEANTKALVARLSWKSNVTGNFVFVNRQGHKVKNMSLNGLAIELRAGRVKRIESVSVFDRAIDTIMTKMRH